MKNILLKNYVPEVPEPIDSEPCELYDSCADIMTPKEAMLKMLATGQQVDLNRRQAFYDSEEMQDYIEAEYPCDYITAYKEYMDNLNHSRVKVSKGSQESQKKEATKAEPIKVQETQTENK